MSSTTYGVYTNNGSVDTEVLTEEIEDNLRADEKASRIMQLLNRVINSHSCPEGSTWVVQSTNLQRKDV